MNGSELIKELHENIDQQRKILNNIKKLSGLREVEDKNLILTQINDLKQELKKLNNQSYHLLEDLKLSKTFFQTFFGIGRFLNLLKKESNIKTDDLEKETLKRLKEKSKIKKKKREGKDSLGKIADKLFSETSKRLSKNNYFRKIEDDLERSNLKNSLQGYISKILLSTLLAFIAGVIIFLFFTFITIEPTMPIVKLVENPLSRLGKLIWIVVAFPLTAFFVSYSYPSLERKSVEAQINYELPFATINMSAIAGSMINPLKIFEIIVSSNEFPNVQREFTKLINEMNVYGYDLVSALKSTAKSTPSKNMEELLNGLATTIGSGGDLTKFFETRANTLLFEYKLNREKETKAAETFMDLYISIVIAAPMILMLLLMMMKISGLGISMSTSAITLIMVSSVSMINIFFLVFLHLRKRK